MDHERDYAVRKQHVTTRTSHPGIWHLIIKDIEEGKHALLMTQGERDLLLSDMRQREVLGSEKYHTVLQPHNGMEAAVKAYQDALDVCAYARMKAEELADYVPWWRIYNDAVNLAAYILVQIEGEKRGG